MSRSWKLLALSALLLACWGSTLGVARDEPDKAGDPSKDIEEIKKQLKEIRNDLKTLKGLPDLGLRVEELEMKFGNLEEGFRRLVTDFDRLTKSNQRIMKALDPATRPTSGTIRLENRSRVRATVVLGGVSYDLQPGEVREIKNRPAGTFDYYVLADGFGQISAPVTRTLNAGEVFTIYINP
jgi:hypothetical protein